MILTKVETGNIEITIEGDDSGAWQVFIKNPDDDEPILLLAIRIGSEKENGEFIDDLAKALIESVNNIEENDMRIRDKLRELQELCEEKGTPERTIVLTQTKTSVMIAFEYHDDGLEIGTIPGDAACYDLTPEGLDDAIAFIKEQLVTSSTEVNIPMESKPFAERLPVEDESPIANGATASLSTDGGETEGFTGTVESETPEVE